MRVVTSKKSENTNIKVGHSMYVSIGVAFKTFVVVEISMATTQVSSWLHANNQNLTLENKFKR